MIRWERRRRRNRQAAIIHAMCGNGDLLEWTALQSCEAAGLRSGTIHADLARLEQLGLVASGWDTALCPPPRRRLYWPTPSAWHLDTDRYLSTGDIVDHGRYW